jgi:hypothetical protein
MSTILGTGRLQHHFWGQYHATVILQWSSVALAQQALQIFPLFKVHPEDSRVLVYHGTGAELKQVEQALRAAGADMRKVTSVAKSIDFGEPFTVGMPLYAAAPDTSTQLELL